MPVTCHPPLPPKVVTTQISPDIARWPLGAKWSPLRTTGVFLSWSGGTSNSWFNSLLASLWFPSPFTFLLLKLMLCLTLCSHGAISQLLVILDSSLRRNHFQEQEGEVVGKPTSPYLEAWIMGWWIRFSVGHSLQGTNWLQDRGADPAYRCEILGWDGAFYILNSMPLGETCTLQFSMASPRQCISVLYLSGSHIYMACLATVSSWSSWPIML